MLGKKTAKKIELSLLPTIEIEGQEWEYRAKSPAVIRAAQKIALVKAPESENMGELLAAIDETLGIFREFLGALFVRGDELYKLMDAKYGGDIECWLEFVNSLIEAIAADFEAPMADLKRFKAASS